MLVVVRVEGLDGDRTHLALPLALGDLLGDRVDHSLVDRSFIAALADPLRQRLALDGGSRAPAC